MSSVPKKILITIFRGQSASNILRSGVLTGLLQNGLRVVLLTTREREENYQKEFRHEQVSVISIADFKEKIGDTVVRFLAQNSVRNERVLFKHVEDLYGHKKTLGALLRFCFKRVLGFLGLIPGVRALIRSFALRFPSSNKEISAILRRENPQLVFCPDVVQDMDVVVLREARRLSIATVGLVSGWDNLTNPGLLRIVPDMLLAHSPWLKRAAIDLQGIPEEKVKMVGIPQYDSFFRKDFLKPRVEFLQSLGIDPQSRLILFAAMGSQRLAPYEWETPQMINDAIDRGDLPPECLVAARPHPKYGIGSYAKKPEGRYLFIDEPAKYLSASVESWDMERKHMDHLANILYHADVVVTGASTITIDAAVLDRPVINVAFDGGHTLPNFQSIRKNYYYFTHYIALMKTKGMRLVFSEAELIEWIKQYLANPSLDREERKQIVQDFVGFTDGRSVERIVSAIVEMFA